MQVLCQFICIALKTPSYQRFKKNINAEIASVSPADTDSSSNITSVFKNIQ